MPLLAIAVCTLLFFERASDNQFDLIGSELSQVVLALIYLLLFPTTLWIFAALSVKRLHDMGIAGWGALVVLFPAVAFIVFIILCWLNGTDGPNKYGPAKNSRSHKGGQI